MSGSRTRYEIAAFVAPLRQCRRAMTMSVLRGIVLQNSFLSWRFLLARWFGGFLFACGCSARDSQRWRSTGGAWPVASGSARPCEQYFVPDAAQAPQPKPVEPENAFHMGKPHLDFFALAARLLEGFRIGQRTDTIAYIFVEVAGNFTHDRRRAFGLQGAGWPASRPLIRKSRTRCPQAAISRL